MSKLVYRRAARMAGVLREGFGERPVRCRICKDFKGKPGTRLCDPCWELDKHIRSRPKIARKVLEAVEREQAPRGRTA